jgi:hypothetical protein
MGETIPDILLCQADFILFALDIILPSTDTIVFSPDVRELTTDAVLVPRNVGLLIPDHILLVFDADQLFFETGIVLVDTILVLLNG